MRDIDHRRKLKAITVFPSVSGASFDGRRALKNVFVSDQALPANLG